MLVIAGGLSASYGDHLFRQQQCWKAGPAWSKCRWQLRFLTCCPSLVVKHVDTVNQHFLNSTKKCVQWQWHDPQDHAAAGCVCFKGVLSPWGRDARNPAGSSPSLQHSTKMRLKTTSGLQHSRILKQQLPPVHGEEMEIERWLCKSHTGSCDALQKEKYVWILSSFDFQ